MKYLVIVALVVLGIVFLHQKSAETPSAAAASATPQATLTPRAASEHDWAKSATDRAQAVKDQVRRERAANEAP